MVAEDEDEAEPEQFGCVFDAEELEGFNVVHRRKATRPSPKAATVNDFIPTPISNRFEELKGDADPVKSVNQIKREKKKAWRDSQQGRSDTAKVSREHLAVPADEAVRAETPREAAD